MQFLFVEFEVLESILHNISHLSYTGILFGIDVEQTDCSFQQLFFGHTYPVV